MFNLLCCSNFRGITVIFECVRISIICQNPPTDSEVRERERLNFYNLYRLVTLKIRSRSPKSDQLLSVSHDTIYTV